MPLLKCLHHLPTVLPVYCGYDYSPALSLIRYMYIVRLIMGEIFISNFIKLSLERWYGGLRRRRTSLDCTHSAIFRSARSAPPAHSHISYSYGCARTHNFDLIQSGITLIRERHGTTLNTELFLDQRA